MLSTLLTILAQAEPRIDDPHDQTAFFIAGGLLAVWAVVLAVLGIRSARFPGGAGGERIVILITAVLVIGTTSTAVITA
jgi:hypothetical protein